MKIISWNINGLRAIAKKNLRETITSHKPDILCLQETKITDDNLTNDLRLVDLSSEQYFSFAEKKGYSGVATYFFSSESKQVADIRTSFGNEFFKREGRILVTELKEIRLYNLYFPSGTTGEERQSVKYNFLAMVTDHLRNLSPAEKKRVVICGDFNICHQDMDIHHPREAEKKQLSGFLPEERKWMDEFIGLGFVDSFRYLHPALKDHYSWWTYRAGARSKNLGWRIDYFFVSKTLAPRIHQAKILAEVGGSDHCPIVLELSKTK